MQEDIQALVRIKRDVLYGHDIAPPSVDLDKCNGCGLCVRVCPGLVLELREKKSNVTHGERCIACGHCSAVCPEEAVIQNETATLTSPRPRPVPPVAPDALQLLIRERRSTRLYSDKPVAREQLLQIIEAGRYAPTGANRQDVHYIVVSGQERVSELRLLVESFMEKLFKQIQNRAIASFVGMRFGRSALDILRYYALGYRFQKESRERGAYFPLPFGQAVIITHAQSFDTTAQFNCSMALYGCGLMAHSLGLGSCFLGFVQLGANMDKRIKHWLEIPKENQCYGAMVVGYPDIKYRRLVERQSPDIRWR